MNDLLHIDPRFDPALASALRRSANLTLRRHRALGLPIVTADGDRVVHLDPATMQEIPEGEVDAFIERAKASWDE